MQTRANCTVLTTAAFLISCASPDSATVDSTTATWQVADTPLVTIGKTDGDERYMFNRIVGVLLLPQGRILVADAQPQLTLYDSSGVFIGRWGRRGTGPGEFQLLWHAPFRMRGDSVGVWDFSDRRLTVFDAAGNLGRVVSVTPPRVYWPAGTIPMSDCCRVEHAYSDGAVIMGFPAIVPTVPGPARHATVTLVRIAPDGAFRDTLASFRDQRYSSAPSSPSGVRANKLSGRFWYTLLGDTIVGGNGDGNMLLRVVPGLPVDTIRLAGAPVPITQEVKDVFAKAYRDEYARRPGIFEGSVESLIAGDYAESLPAYTSIGSDDEGNIWLASFVMPFSKEPMEYRVYTSRGRQIASLRMPVGVSLHDVSRGRIAVVARDEMDVQSVRVYQLKRFR